MDSDQLKAYYRKLLPLDVIFKCLGINECREVSFGTLSGSYIRFLSFGSVDEFRKKLMSIVPERIDIGAVYKGRPAKHNCPRVASKELVFDIDLTDYPRSCCNEKAVCEQCFALVKAAIKILDYSLHHEFGFHKIGFVFSGRRGVHCWVFDEAAQMLSDAERGEIVKYYDSVISNKEYPEQYVKILRECIMHTESKELDEACMDDAEMFEKMYLRIDRDVTQRRRHLIKMPFSVHPSTLVISVPIDARNVDAIKLDEFPKLKDVLESPEVLDPYIAIAQSWIERNDI
ncbi:catalytic subunit of DNA primase [Ordospora colligata]|uniref:DNA primase small subunit n=1 Tax=Ordospora colligata OC4 TaxID=1354746 RepID=A0A0B2UDJ4_9MICR|nr:catalytic subunit of DNA primase [Ordospora colligata OC4]KHN69136.1 catalytic subunit of DNA primase [Ordospora colligata OC4]TBU14591.1 catalytic subunit of DNA primase [Ordospora colligata]TBU14785.1 catalytic subunit of DNA primase [Ordospora colligata]TBU18219.1 catalytic subunit of DNA primase [Ordospora colligata]